MQTKNRFRIVFMCIFALTHHLPTISASASDLLLSTISPPSPSSMSFSPLTMPSSSARLASDVAAKNGIGSSTATNLNAIENDFAAEKIVNAAAAAESSRDSSLLSSPPGQFEHREKLAAHRQTRSLFYSYPFASSMYGSSYYNGYYPSYSYPSVYKYWGAYNTYYGYPRPVYG